MHNQNEKEMKKVVGLCLIVSFILSSCGPKPYYKTSEGKRKQKYYNEIQFGGKNPATTKKKF